MIPNAVHGGEVPPLAAQGFVLVTRTEDGTQAALGKKKSEALHLKLPKSTSPSFDVH